MVEKLALSVKEAAAAIGISDRKIWDLINVSGFPSARLGGRVIIPVDDLRRWLSQQAVSGEKVEL